MQRAPRRAAGELRFGVFRGADHELRVEARKALELSLTRLGAAQERLAELHRGEATPPNRLGGRYESGRNRVTHPRPFTLSVAAKPPCPTGPCPR